MPVVMLMADQRTIYWCRCLICGGTGVDPYKDRTPCETCDGKGRFYMDAATGKRVLVVNRDERDPEPTPAWLRTWEGGQC